MPQEVMSPASAPVIQVTDDHLAGQQWKSLERDRKEMAVKNIEAVKTSAKRCELEETAQSAYYTSHLPYPHYFLHLARKPHPGIQNPQFPHKFSSKPSHLYHSYPP